MSPATPARRHRPPPWRGVSLTTRILVMNVIAFAILAFSLLYLDSYRNQLLAERFRHARTSAEVIGAALARLPTAERRDSLLTQVGADQHWRLRLYDEQGQLVADSFALSPTGPSFALVDPEQDSVLAWAARLLDRGMDWVLGAPQVRPYAEPPVVDSAAHWPEIALASKLPGTVVQLRYASDRTPIITAATPVQPETASMWPGRRAFRGTLLILSNDRDITQSVRDARQTFALVVLAALLLTVFLSLFLARTIVQPLRGLVRSAVRVRLGRDRAVVVPRLPERGDEIGLLARALSDMTRALHQRMDAVERFAADVAHEIKNPLASLRSALESLDKVDDPDLRRQLADIAHHDVQRIDRLVTEIAEASRIDAELSRTTFVPVDMHALAVELAGERTRRGANGACQLRIVQRGTEPTLVDGAPARLERVLHNLIDNAVSFSPPDGTVVVSVHGDGGEVTLEVEDEGPGIPPHQRERVFERFHSLRPATEDFGAHSGLGLAIARTIIEAHDGTLTAQEPRIDRDHGRIGARLVIRLPAYAPPGEETE
ncbi:sensor histidine kinase [Novosphingobium ovatum]|nr:ATP-binding protein [Novosphingobium ovatum]